MLEHPGCLLQLRGKKRQLPCFGRTSQQQVPDLGGWWWCGPGGGRARSSGASPCMACKLVDFEEEGGSPSPSRPVLRAFRPSLSHPPSTRALLNQIIVLSYPTGRHSFYRPTESWFGTALHVGLENVFEIGYPWFC